MEEPRYRKLLVWQKAHKNALAIIDLLEKINFRFSHIVIQCIDSATSIGANIAEGNASNSQKVKEKYFEIALNSAYEFDNWLQILIDSKVICSDKNSLRIIEQGNIEAVKILTKLLKNLSS
jgi:four helix bundle protein